MSLNFPSDTSNPYVDPSSGLKYVYNGSVGAWETALQPPVVVSDTPPTLDIPGFLWWDSISGTLFVRYNDGNSEQWVEATPSAVAKQSFVAPTAPPLAASGDIWWNTLERKLYIRAEEAWEDVALRVNEYVADTSQDITFSYYSPKTYKQGDLWYSRAEGRMYIYSAIQDFEGWKALTPEPKPVDIGVGSVAVDEPLVVNKLGSTVELSVRAASTNSTGVMRFASQTEVNEGRGRAAVTPTTLKEAFDKYLPTIPEVASLQEVIEGVANKVVTAEQLASVMVDGNPTGTVISFAGSTAPLGYLLCDGSEVSRTDYADLFSVIGTDYGIGNGATTFNLPNLTGTVNQLIKI